MRPDSIPKAKVREPPPAASWASPRAPPGAADDDRQTHGLRRHARRHGHAFQHGPRSYDFRVVRHDGRDGVYFDRILGSDDDGVELRLGARCRRRRDERADGLAQSLEGVAKAKPAFQVDPSPREAAGAAGPGAALRRRGGARRFGGPWRLGFRSWGEGRVLGGSFAGW